MTPERGESRSVFDMAVGASGELWITCRGKLAVFRNGNFRPYRRETKTGPWQTINTLTKIKTKPSGEVFSLWLDHGRGLSNADYAYCVIPGVQKNEAAAAATITMPRTLANTDKLQAVEEAAGDLVQIVFWQAGNIPLPNGRVVNVDAPCLLQLKRTAEDWAIAAGNLSQELTVLHVSLFDDQEKTKPQLLTFDFPRGAYAGRTLVQVIAP